jgi:hypothetical protein
VIYFKPPWLARAKYAAVSLHEVLKILSQKPQ